MKNHRKLVGLIVLFGCCLRTSFAQSFPITELFQDFVALLEKDPNAETLRKNLRGPQISDERIQSGNLTLGPFYQPKSLVWTASTKDLRLLIFDPSSKSWPGSQPITVVLTDSDLDVRDWIEIGGSPVFRFAELDESSLKLKVNYLQRNGGAFIQTVQIHTRNLELIDSRSVAERNLGTYLYEEKHIQQISGANEPQRSTP